MTTPPAPSGPVEFDATVTLRRPATATTPAVALGTVRATGTFTPPPASPAPLGVRVRWGGFVYEGVDGAGRGDPWDPAPHLALEQRLGVRLDPVSCFLPWTADFPAAQFAAYGSRDLLIAWHPDSVAAVDILAGKWDAYLDRWAAAVQAYPGGQVFLRLMPEMNGEWSRWSAAYAGANPMGITNALTYSTVWRYVVTRVRRTTGRARWVFCPNITDEPGRVGNRLEDYYPGSSWVDVLGFDGYNWGDSGNGVFRWTSFHDLLGTPQGSATRSIYDRLAALHPTAPIWWCELGCKDPAKDDGPIPGVSPPNPGRSKAQWYADALKLTGFPRLTTLVAFDTAKERDWRLLADPATPSFLAVS